VLAGDEPAGEVTSGNFSPILGHGIALAFVRPDVVIGDDVEIDVRGTRLPGRIVPTPFVRR
jgi:aminomethyltransferase